MLDGSLVGMAYWNVHVSSESVHKSPQNWPILWAMVKQIHIKHVHSSFSYQQGICQNMVGMDVNRLVGMALKVTWNLCILSKR